MKDENQSPETNDTSEQQAQEYVEKLRDQQTLDDILETIGEIGTHEQEKAGESLEALKRPVNEMMNDKNGDLPEQLSKLRKTVNDLEPDYLKEGKWKSFLNKLLRKSPMDKYAQKYRNVETEVEEIIEALLKGRDRLQEDNVMLIQLKEVAHERIINLNEQIEIGKQLNELLEQEKEKDTLDNDSTAIQKGQQKVLTRIKNMTQAVHVLQQSLASVDMIIENNDKLEEAIFNAITMTKNIITVTASIQLALGNQKQVINAVNDVNDATESMLLSNAEMLKSNTEETLKTLEEPAIALESFKKAYQDVHDAIALTEQSNERIIQSSKQFVQDLDELNQEMGKKLLKE
ncbi:toxic anion resistance protein [Texcoconibacillus texcoconensis]|uniref:Uncharacterized protein YaaN involved in tellurite resistance n=1 Tax=Texcoconibacillus texcoconensis TaxID=1095777 RepID=A0A840QQH4_9BACI|nr:toxic anion resistance protein [Texcoconibacillus texcoconensis]MBB5173610.1 uncharacterized protein YaaN involved in tellurite resistance [Texcoconibacillus texcoconensis]